MFKAGFVTIAGKPNVGKSTLLNAIVGEKVAIVSWRPQTTRNKINGIINGEDYQAVFVDTPGIHDSKNQLGEYMMRSVKAALNGVDAVVYVIAGDKRVDDKDLEFIERYANSEIPIIVAINKVDSVEKKAIFDIMQKLTDIEGVKDIIPISALKGDNVKILKEAVVALLPEGDAFYPEDMYTDRNLRFMAAEIIREKAMKSLSDEVPYGICVNLNSFKDDAKGITHIDADIVVEKKAHKPIIIGKGGLMLKKIGTEARLDLEKMLGNKVFLELWVRVKEEWRDSTYLLGEMGYSPEEI